MFLMISLFDAGQQQQQQHYYETHTCNCTARQAYSLEYNLARKEADPYPDDIGQLSDGKYTLAAYYGGIVLLNILSVLLSGLVMGLLALDITELEILRKCGTEKERQYAAAIIPMRRHSNLLLCSLVIGNVIVNTGLQYFLDTVFPGLIGFIATTICRTIFSEIMPLAVLARHALAIGAKTIWIIWIVITLTFPIAYPLSLFLDCAMGEEIAFVYDRERLQEYIRITRSYNNLDANEMNIIMGALKIKKITVGKVMTKLRDVFMLPLDTIINHQTIITIVEKGFSRIPVFDKTRRNIVGLLLVKDLASVHPCQEVSLKSLLLLNKHLVCSVDENYTLDVIFSYFRGAKSQLALVREHKRRDIVGIVTMDDIIEEVLQVEISEESEFVVYNNKDLKERPDAMIPPELEPLHIHLIDAIARRRAKEKLLAQQATSCNYRALTFQQQPNQANTRDQHFHQQQQATGNTNSNKRRHPERGENKTPPQIGQTPAPAATPNQQPDNKPSSSMENKPST